MIRLFIGEHNADIAREMKLSPEAIPFVGGRIHPTRAVERFAAMVAVAIGSGTDLIVATHVDAIVNWIGEQIEARTIPREAVTIVLCTREGAREFQLDERGYLGGSWPVGFFCAADVPMPGSAAA